MMETNEITSIIIPEDRDSICRFCLKLSNDLVSINDSSVNIKWHKAENLSIQEVINKLCLKIDYAKFLPNRICEKCRTFLEDFFIFVETIESNEEFLRSVYEVAGSSEKDDTFNSCVDNKNEGNIGEEIENAFNNVINFEHDYESINKITSEFGNCENNKLSKEYEDSTSSLSENIYEVVVENPGTSVQNEYNSPINYNCTRINKNDKAQLAENLVQKIPRKDAGLSNVNIKDGINTKFLACTKEDGTIQVKKLTPVTTRKKRKRKNLRYASPVKETEEKEELICIKQCFFCEEKFSNDDLTKLHYLKHVVQATEGMVPQRPFCFYCGLLPYTKEDLDEHIMSKHQNENEVNCSDCKIRFSNSDEMKKHVDNRHIEHFEEVDTEPKCLICEKVFEDIDDLMIHSLEHISRRHTCISCKNIYICQGALNEHHRTHPQYKHKCPICKKWQPAGGMKPHLKRHGSGTSFECHICKRVFRSMTHFNKHWKIHSKPDIVCPECPYTTKWSNSFVLHMRTHSNEKPFKCTFEECGKAYKTSSALSSHVKEHLNLKNYACEFCDYRSTRAVGLEEHRRMHTGEKPLSCRYCSKTFSRRYGLSIHIKKVHPKVE